MREILAPLLLLASTAIAAPGDKLFVSGSVVNIREQPAASAKIVTEVSRGQELIEFGREDEWVAVGIVGTGKDGYIHKSLVSTTRPSGPAPSATTPEYQRFAAAFRQLNDSMQSQYGIRLFSGSRYKGDGIVEVTATSDWVKAPADNQRSSLNTVFDLWDAAEGTGLPIAVYVVDGGGRELMRKARR